ncbi:MAG: DUF4440 domain-containing protein [candidate division Zixibacteria bacterium]|nr:DUF4440 domain-containing protein [candidate division Zixibacteria bacterium]
MNIQEACRNEIDALHRCFEDWFNGRVPRTAEAFDRIDTALGEAFVIVMPQGSKVERGPLLKGLYDAHSGRQGIRIWIENVRVLEEDRTLVVAEYEEWQTEGGETTSRHSTAVFRRNDEKPNGLEWLRVHETWFDRGPASS